MGIYIKDIEMPKDDGRLSIDIFPNGKVCINLDLECNQIATAIPIPTPHGILIDADELKKKKYHSGITHENAVAVAEIDWLPTVIDAEEADDKEV